MQVATAKRALYGAPYCGDECGHWQSGGKITLCMVDGLGHGEAAERVAKAAVDYVARHLSEPLQSIFAGCNLLLRSTRGVAMSVVVIDENAGKLTHAGIGNTRAMIVGEKIIHLATNSGIVGGGYKILTPESLPLNPGDLVILSTDGIANMIDIPHYDSAARAGLGRLAKTILQLYGLETDDAAVLVFRSER